MKGDKNLIPSQVSLQNSLFIFFQDTCVSNFIESIREAKMIVSIVCEIDPCKFEFFTDDRFG